MAFVQVLLLALVGIAPSVAGAHTQQEQFQATMKVSVLAISATATSVACWRTQQDLLQQSMLKTDAKDENAKELSSEPDNLVPPPSSLGQMTLRDALRPRFKMVKPLNLAGHNWKGQGVLDDFNLRFCYKKDFKRFEAPDGQRFSWKNPNYKFVNGEGWIQSKAEEWEWKSEKTVEMCTNPLDLSTQLEQLEWEEYAEMVHIVAQPMYCFLNGVSELRSPISLQILKTGEEATHHTTSFDPRGGQVPCGHTLEKYDEKLTPKNGRYFSWQQRRGRMEKGPPQWRPLDVSLHAEPQPGDKKMNKHFQLEHAQPPTKAATDQVDIEEQEAEVNQEAAVNQGDIKEPGDDAEKAEKPTKVDIPKVDGGKKAKVDEKAAGDNKSACGYTFALLPYIVAAMAMWT